jgi:hypothetical protein
MADFDLAIIGGGINGAGIARDAAGRGLKVVLLRAERSRFRHVVGFVEADPRRLALPRTRRAAARARRAQRARGAAAHGAAEGQARMWDVVSFRPGKSPLGALATAFGTAPQGAGPAEIDAYLEREAEFYRTGDADTLARIADRRLDAAPERPDRLFIYVDQWEELYAMAPAAEDKEHLRKRTSDVNKFVELLVAATSDVRRSRATVVLTVRADFYNSLVRSPSVSPFLPQQQVNIPLMGSSDLRSAIETPAEKAGLSFSPPELVDRILNDVGSEENYETRVGHGNARDLEEGG